MKAMIFAAGLGTRLKPLTDTMPKALVPIADAPLLQHVLSKLSSAGFDDIVINVHHFADMIEEWVQGHSEEFSGMHFSFSDERQKLLETGGGVKHATQALCANNDEDRFLIHNVDILSNVNLQEFWQAGSDAEATLLVSERETQRYLIFDDTMRLVGWTNIKTGEVKSPFPKVHEAFDPNYTAPVNSITMQMQASPLAPTAHPYYLLAFAGIHQMSTSLLPLMESWGDCFSIIDFYLSICSQHVIRGHVQSGLQLVDVGKLHTLQVAEEFVNEEN